MTKIKSRKQILIELLNNAYTNQEANEADIRIYNRKIVRTRAGQRDQIASSISVAKEKREDYKDVIDVLDEEIEKEEEKENIIP